MTKNLCCFAAVMLVVVLSTSARASAQRVLVLPARGDEALVRSLGPSVTAGVVRLLGERGYEPVLPRDAREEERWRETIRCTDSGCAAGLLAEQSAAFTVSLAVWPYRERTTRELSAELAFPTGDSRFVELSFERTPPLVELVEGVLAAHEAWRQEDPPAIELPGLPPPIGPVPSHDTRTRSSANAVFGVALLLGAAAPTTLGAIAAARDGECVRPGSGGACRNEAGSTEVYDFGRRSAALIGVGAALGVTGLVLLGARPIRVSAAMDGTSTLVGVSGTF